MPNKPCGGATAPLFSELTWLRRRKALEDTPTHCIRPRQETLSPPPAPAPQTPEETRELLAVQNKLLCDILGSISALTAAQLALGRRG